MSIEQLILSVGTILLVARLAGLLFRWIGQPQVVGEMVAGIVLGPSFFGREFPAAFNYVFPATAIPTLTSLSQLGLLLFIFVVGLEVDGERVFKHRGVVVLTSHSSILLPLVLGIGLAVPFYPRFAGVGVAFLPFALFMGTAMSVTAFPVLAGILKERRLLESDLGAMAISCAAVDDVSAWVLLAVLTAIARSERSWAHPAVVLFLLVVFAAAMFLIVRPAVAFVEKLSRSGKSNLGPFCGLIFIALASSWITERLGVHALFGAFMAGLIMPKGTPLIADTIKKLESVTVVLLLPIFFVLTGLRTHFDLLSSAGAWGSTLAVIGVAIVGKVAGASLSSRAQGAAWRDALALGFLMNTRGLVELVILNAGLELGVLSTGLFSMMVAMALVTTFMTTPILIGIYRAPGETSRSLMAARS
jgi:Kef-type K+ transport system membrane component KefB